MIKGVVVGQPRKTRVLAFECPKCRKEHSVFIRKVCEWPDNPYRSMPGVGHQHLYCRQEDGVVMVRPAHLSECGFHTNFEWGVVVGAIRQAEAPPSRPDTGETRAERQ